MNVRGYVSMFIIFHINSLVDVLTLVRKNISVNIRQAKDFNKRVIDNN